MKECSKETILLAHWFDLLPGRNIDLERYVDRIDEPCLVETLHRNKLVVMFLRKLEKNVALKELVFRKFPRVEAISQQMSDKIEQDSLEFGKIKEIFSRHAIEFMLIKSAGSFPYESDNIDILIKPYHLSKVTHILKNNGYFELGEVREPHKFLFRKKLALEILPLHIHTRVEWEGTQFVDPQYLWSRSKFSTEDGGFIVPSPEDCILITTAHLFFENHEVKLYDLVKIFSELRDFAVDWDYLLQHSRSQHWDDAFLLTMFLMDQIWRNLYGRNLVHPSMLLKLKKIDYGYNKLEKMFFNPLSFEVPPIKIPYLVSGIYFLRRVFHDPSSSLIQKVNHTLWVSSEVSKLRIKGLHLLNTPS